MSVPPLVVVLLAASTSAALGQTPPVKAAPDLWTKAIIAPLAAATFDPGARFTVTITVENRGTAVAPGSDRGGYMIDLSLGLRPAAFPASAHTLPAPYRFVEGMLLSGGRISRTVDLAPGASRDYSAVVVLPAEIKPGKYWLQITVDPLARVAEPQPYPRGENDDITNTHIEVRPPA